MTLENKPQAVVNIFLPLLSDGDGSVILRPGNKYEYKFGFELPQG